VVIIVVLSIASALLMGAGAYLAAGVSAGEALRNEVRPHPARASPRRVQVLDRLLTAEIRRELALTGTPPRQYLLKSLVMGAGGALLFGLAFQPVVAVPGFLLGVGANRMTLRRRFTGWRQEVVSRSGDLATLLKIRLQAGETVDQAVRAVLPELKGALRVEWERMLAEREAGKALRDALRSLSDRVADRDVTAILTALEAYDRDSVPEDPFHDLAGHIAHVRAIRREYEVRRSTSNITLLVGVAFFSAFLTGVAPAVYVLWVQATQGVPI
jgi:Flp pilus assembly protein TadB